MHLLWLFTKVNYNRLIFLVSSHHTLCVTWLTSVLCFVEKCKHLFIASYHIRNTDKHNICDVLVCDTCFIEKSEQFFLHVFPVRENTILLFSKNHGNSEFLTYGPIFCNSDTIHFNLSYSPNFFIQNNRINQSWKVRSYFLQDLALDASSNSLLSSNLSMRRECQEFPKMVENSKSPKKLHVSILKMNSLHSLHLTCRITPRSH